MMELPDLSFDNMSEVNTSEAINYLKLNKFEFNCIGKEGTVFSKTISHKGQSLKYKVVMRQELPEFEKPIDLKQKLQHLAKEVESNASLFSQIEHLTRNYSVEQVFDCDVKLIVQNLLYWSDTTVECTPSLDFNIDVGSDTNLATLGLVAQLLRFGVQYPSITSNEDTVVTCHLFTELCSKVGLSNVTLRFSDKLKTVETSRYPGNCVGVITENADIDSAVDVLLESSAMCPWKLARVLVQESVYNTFKRALQWKTALQHPSTVTIADDRKSKCTEVYAYKGKVLYVDYAGDHADGNIAVEAYRTTKELLSLVADGAHSFMSLWSNSLSESNEIAYSEWAPHTTWINDFGVFDGPAKSSQPFYERFYYSIKQSATKSVMEKQKQWSRLTFEQRRNLIVTALNNIKDCETLRVATASFLTLAIQNLNKNDVYVDNGKMCVCITKPHKVAHCYYSEFVKILQVLVIGAAVVQCVTRLEDLNKLVNALGQVGAPIEFDNIVKEVEVMASRVGGYTKVVWSNFGTTFAN